MARNTIENKTKKMSKKKKAWVYRPTKPKVPDSVKSELTEKAERIIETILKPKYIKEKPKDYEYNYLVNIFSKWYSNYFYFCSRYNCPGPHAISPSFDAKFARMEYQLNGNFIISYMRHTDQWQEVRYDLSMEEALQNICDGPEFFP
jgi:hypothetical protein